MTFDIALRFLREGKTVCRLSWQRDGAFLYLVPGSVFAVDRQPLLGIFPRGAEVTYRSHIDKRDSGGCVSPWSPTQEDLLADDWITTGYSDR